MKRLVIDAGHGGTDPGAVGFGTNEREQMALMANALIKQAKRFNIPTLQIANDINTYEVNYYQNHTFNSTDVILELHRDGASNTARGGSVLISDRYDADNIDTALGDVISRWFGNYRGIKKRNDLQNLNVCASRGYNYRLLELGFITNQADKELLDSASEFDKLAYEMIKSIYKQFDGAKYIDYEVKTTTKYYGKVVQYFDDLVFLDPTLKGKFLIELTDTRGIFKDKACTIKDTSADRHAGFRYIGKSIGWQNNGRYWVHEFISNNGKPYYIAYGMKV